MRYYIIVFVVASLLIGCAKSKEEKELKIEENNISIRIEGSVYPSQQQEVIAESSGKIKKLYIKYGSEVNKGDLIYSLDKELLNLDIQNKKQELKLLKKIYAKVKEDNTQYKDSSEIIIAARELKKVAYLKSEGYLREFEENGYKKNYINAIDAKRNKEMSQYEKRKNIETSLFAKKIELKKLYYQLNHSDGYAGMHGLIAKIELQEGENIGVDKKICTIVNLDKVIVRAGFATGLLPFIHKKRDVQVSFVTTPPYKTVAKITEIRPIVNPSFESMTLDIEVPNKEYMLQEGTRALVNITLSKEGQKRVRTYFIHNKNDRVVQLQSKI